MKKICMTDTTLRALSASGTLNFKEKVDLCKLLNRVNVSSIELPPLSGSHADAIFVKTLASVISDATLALPVALSPDSPQKSWDALKTARRARLIVDVPVSSVQMEYLAHKKPPQMLEAIGSQVRACAALCRDVEFCAADATRAEEDFLCTALRTAIEAGATSITLCDTAGLLLPEEFGAFVERVFAAVPELENVFVKVSCNDELGLGAACAMQAVRHGALGVKACLTGHTAPQLKTLCAILSRRGESLDYTCSVRTTELNHVLSRFSPLLGHEETEEKTSRAESDEAVTYDAADAPSVIFDAVRGLGYDLTREELDRVYAAFRRVADKKPVTVKELDAIVAANAMQVPPTYTLERYVINSGNSIASTACLCLKKGDEILEGLAMGDGSIDAAFKAMESVTGRHFELEDFRISAVTEGKEAIGRTVVKLRSEGRLSAGSGISTDIVDAAIRAYLDALNKIVYEEKES